MGSIQRYLTGVNLVPVLALFLVLAGGAYAVTTAKRNSVASKSVANSSLKGADFFDDTLGGQDVTEATLVVPAGPQGPKGEKGNSGDPGQSGSPETAQEVLDKLETVDGAGTGLDADKFDGRESCHTNGVISLDDDAAAMTVCTRSGATLSVDCDSSPTDTTAKATVSQTSVGPSARGFEGSSSASNNGTSHGVGIATDPTLGGNPVAGSQEFFSAQSDGGGIIGTIAAVADATGTSDGICHYIVRGFG